MSPEVVDLIKIIIWPLVVFFISREFVSVLRLYATRDTRLAAQNHAESITNGVFDAVGANTSRGCLQSILCSMRRRRGTITGNAAVVDAVIN